MNLLSIPRHQLEISVTDYLDIIQSLIRPNHREAVAEFERQFAAHIGCRHAIAVSSGRLGMHLILECLGAAQGSEAIVPAFNLFAVIERFCQLGIRPRFCDVRREDLNIDVDQVESLITPKTQFLLATHMFGHPADVVKLREIANRRGLILIEDCAHALGSKIAGRSVGTFGKAAIFSFSVLKLVTTFGGGMVVTDDDKLASRIRASLKQCQEAPSMLGAFKKALIGTIMDLGTRRAIFSLGAWPALRVVRVLWPEFQQKLMTEQPHPDRNFDPNTIGPLHAFQARLGISQLAKADELVRRRWEVRGWLDQALADIPQLTTFEPCADGQINGLYYGVLADRAAQLAEYLFRRGIDCETSEYRNCAALEMYRDVGDRCAVAAEVESRILRLPNYPSLSRREVRRMGQGIRTFFNQHVRGPSGSRLCKEPL